MFEPASGGVSAVLAGARGAFWGAATFTCALNILGLTGSLYTLQIYDRVIPSRSTSTLIALTILAIVLYAAYAALGHLRGRLLSRAGLVVIGTLEHQVIAAQSELAASHSRRNRAREPLIDLDRVREFLSSSGPAAILDLPWLPLYLAAIFLLHPMLGLVATAATVGLALIAGLSEISTTALRQRAAAEARERSALADILWRDAEIVQTMGMARGLQARWLRRSRLSTRNDVAANDAAQACLGAARFVRLTCPVGIVGLGALLVIHGEMSAGAILAGTIISTRMLSCVDAGLSNWRSFIYFLESCRRLSESLRNSPAKYWQDDSPPAPKENVTVEHLTVMPPGASRPLVHDLSFRLEAGSGLGIIGASGSGKTTVARALVGAAEIRAGSVRLDGVPLSRWAAHARGEIIGYLPQNATLLPGSIGDNISRFAAEVDTAKLTAAAKTAGIHEIISRMAEGYDTRIGASGLPLSAGESQCIALARALYGDPFLVVLDEPDANLDGSSVAALNAALRAVRQRGGIVVVLSHRLTALESVDTLMSLSNGRLQFWGRKDETLRRTADPGPQGGRPVPPVFSPSTSPVQTSLKIVSEQQGSGPA